MANDMTFLSNGLVHSSSRLVQVPGCLQIDPHFSAGPKGSFKLNGELWRDASLAIDDLVYLGVCAAQHSCQLRLVDAASCQIKAAQDFAWMAWIRIWFYGHDNSL